MILITKSKLEELNRYSLEELAVKFPNWLQALMVKASMLGMHISKFRRELETFFTKFPNKIVRLK